MLDHSLPNASHPLHRRVGKLVLAVVMVLITAIGGIVIAAPPAAAVIICTNSIDNPHNSTHVPGQVNVVGRTACSGPVGGIWQTIQLYRSGVSVAYNYNYQVPGGVYAQVQANTLCVPGVYHGTLQTYVTGGTPYPSNVISNVVTISC